MRRTSLARRAHRRESTQFETIVVIYAENRSFDNLYGIISRRRRAAERNAPRNPCSCDRDGSALKELPPIWDGLTAKGVTPPVTQAQTEHLPNRPFAIDDPERASTTPLGVITHDLWHRFYQNQMQINGGKNDRFVAYADSGALVMGHYDGSKLPLWNIAQKYTLADNFFMGAFGGSFLNHHLAGLRLRADLSERRQEPGQAPRSRRSSPTA